MSQVAATQTVQTQTKAKPKPAKAKTKQETKPKPKPKEAPPVPAAPATPPVPVQTVQTTQTAQQLTPVLEDAYTAGDAADWIQILEDVPELLTDLCWIIEGKVEISWNGIKFLINELTATGWEFHFDFEGFPTALQKPDENDRSTWKYVSFIRVIGKTPKGQTNETIGLGDCLYLKNGAIDQHAERKAFSFAKRNALKEQLPMARLRKFIETYKGEAKHLPPAVTGKPVSTEGLQVVDLKNKEKDKKGLCPKCNTPIKCEMTTYSNPEHKNYLQWRNMSDGRAHSQKVGENDWACRADPVAAAPAAPSTPSAPSTPETPAAPTGPLPGAEPSADGGPPPLVPSDSMTEEVGNAMMVQLRDFYKIPAPRLDQLKAGPLDGLKKFYENVTAGVTGHPGGGGRLMLPGDWTEWDIDRIALVISATVLVGMMLYIQFGGGYY